MPAPGRRLWASERHQLWAEGGTYLMIELSMAGFQKAGSCRRHNCGVSSNTLLLGEFGSTTTESCSTVTAPYICRRLPKQISDRLFDGKSPDGLATNNNERV